MNRDSRFLLGLLALPFILCGWAGASESPSDLYERMRDAVRNIDYEGRFVYQVGDQLDAMYVVHRLQNGRSLERLVALDGKHKQVIRGASAVACLDAHQRRISVLGAGSRLGDAPVASADDLGQVYRFEEGERYRVAGRPARELIIRPRDDLRFGYRIALDEATGLPLRTVVLDENGKVHSQTLFVELKTGSLVTPIERDLSALQLAEMAPSPMAAVSPPALLSEAPLQLDKLPPGFRPIRLPASNPEVQHLLLTDGLASVSLYIEPLQGQPFEGYSSAGAVEMYGARRGDRQVVVVGEVPRRTLDSIAQVLDSE